MDNTIIKRLLAWIGIALVLALFIYISLRSYHFIISPEQSVVSETIVTAEDIKVGSRVNWGEVAILSIVCIGLIYAIRKSDSGSESKE